MIFNVGSSIKGVNLFNCQDTLAKVIQKAPGPELGQRDTFVSLGGGVIGDICGFASSQFLRGVNFIQIPTTVMAQVYYCSTIFMFMSPACTRLFHVDYSNLSFLFHFLTHWSVHNAPG